MKTLLLFIALMVPVSAFSAYDILVPIRPQSLVTVNDNGTKTLKKIYIGSVDIPLSVFKGDTGPVGPVGPSGGPVGPVGPSGLNGVDGQRGLQGVTGASGPRGFDGSTGPKGDIGFQGAKGDLGAGGVISQSPINYQFHVIPADLQNLWYTDYDTWNVLFQSIEFNVYTSNAVVKITLHDNIGIYGANWCQIGLFLDAESVPTCTASFTGVPNTATFNAQQFTCIVPNLTAGVHQFRYTHRSQLCHYGNAAYDNIGNSRFIEFEEVLK